MKLAQSIHQVTMMKKGKLPTNDENQKLMNDVLKQVLDEMENPSLYRHLVSVFGIADGDAMFVSESDLVSMAESNKTAMAALEVKVEEAKENAGDMEVLDARFEVARLAAKSFSRDEALEAYEKVLALPKLSSGKTMDALMESSRIASFYDHLVKNAELVQKVRNDRWELQ